MPWERWSDVRAALAVDAPPSSGTGRLFEAVAAGFAVLARRHVPNDGGVSYGQTAVAAARLGT